MVHSEGKKAQAETAIKIILFISVIKSHNPWNH